VLSGVFLALPLTLESVGFIGAQGLLEENVPEIAGSPWPERECWCVSWLSAQWWSPSLQLKGGRPTGIATLVSHFK
jgi:hypothetical protein